jgi:hypothetical protein
MRLLKRLRRTSRRDGRAGAYRDLVKWMIAGHARLACELMVRRTVTGAPLPLAYFVFAAVASA